MDYKSGGKGIGKVLGIALLSLPFVYGCATTTSTHTTSAPEYRKPERRVEQPKEIPVLEQKDYGCDLDNVLLKEYYPDTWLNETELTRCDAVDFSELEKIIKRAEGNRIDLYDAYFFNLEGMSGEVYELLALQPKTYCCDNSDNTYISITQMAESGYARGWKFTLDSARDGSMDAEIMLGVDEATDNKRRILKYQDLTGEQVCTMLGNYLPKEGWGVTELVSHLNNGGAGLILISPDRYSEVINYAIPGTRDFIIGVQPLSIVTEPETGDGGGPSEEEGAKFKHNKDDIDTPGNEEDTAGTGKEEGENPFEGIPGP